jgi:arginine N-succinyltransferase
LDQYEICAGTTEHLADVCELARHLNTVNLPDNPRAIRELLETSERSFSGELRDPRQREYVFVLSDAASGRVLGTSMIIAQLGRRGVPYIYLEVRTEEKYSATLDRHFVHRVLTTRYSYDGPTEVGGLVMHPESRRSPQRLGSLIAYVRFLFIAMHRADFRDEVLAELLPPFDADGSSPLWEAYGRRFTGLSYREADQLSKSNKEFVRGLFPDEIYATLLSEAAQRSIGEVGPETRGVEKLLRRIGFEYAERVDPFDGGPHFTCATDRITLVRAARERLLTAADPAQLAAASVRGLLGRSYAERPYFRALPVDAAGESPLLAAGFEGLSLAARGRGREPPMAAAADHVSLPFQAGGAPSGVAQPGVTRGAPAAAASTTDRGSPEGGREQSPLAVSQGVIEKMGSLDRGSAFWAPLP